MASSILRVFPRKTSMTPTDDLAVVGDPGLLRPDVDEVHISVAFTWDIEEGKRLREAWAQYYPVVRIGGPALNGEGGEFEPGMYVKEGVTFTSRGCIRRCPWCLVDSPLRLLGIKAGWIVQDNNILATGKEHMGNVFEMLKTQHRGIKFAGGLDTRLVDDWVAEQLRNLRISEVFLAADSNGALKPLAKAVQRLSFLSRDKLRCYVLCAYGDETIEEAENRLRAVWEIGCLPFAQLYQPADRYIKYDRAWKQLARTWSRPAIMKARAWLEVVKEEEDEMAKEVA